MRRENAERRIRERIEKAGFSNVKVKVAKTGNRTVEVSADVRKVNGLGTSVFVEIARAKRPFFKGSGWPERIAEAFVGEHAWRL